MNDLSENIEKTLHGLQLRISRTVTYISNHRVRGYWQKAEGETK